MDKIKVAIVEDDPGWLKAMISFLSKEEDLMIVGTARNRNDAVGLAKTLQVDVFLMDINLNENRCDGIYATAEILQSAKTKIIMMTSLKEEDIIADSFAAGVVDYISKEDYEDIPRTIRSAYSNGFSPVEVLAKEYAKLKREEQLIPLTSAERRIYDLIEQGCTQSQIQKMLMKTKNTLKVQIKNILHKLDVSNSKEAVRKVESGGVLKSKKSDRKLGQ